jgi:hypothetical protein
MTKFNEPLVEWALLAITTVAGAMLFHSVAWGADDPMNCNNNTCVAINYYYNCSTGVPWAMAVSSCLPCAVTNGRCQNGSGTGTSYTPTINPQSLAPMNAYTLCDCIKVNNNGQVEAGGTVTGDYNPTTTKQYLCPR